MPRLVFPGFQFGVPASSVSTAAPTTTDPWSKLVRFAEAWGHSRDTALFPRFERVVPSYAAFQPIPLGSIVTLTYHISTEFPFIIATVGNVMISSYITVSA